MWRPEGWVNDSKEEIEGATFRLLNPTEQRILKACAKAYEEGADAMLKKLELQAVIYVQGRETASDPSIVSVPIPNKKGMWVFIPDEATP